MPRRCVSAGAGFFLSTKDFGAFNSGCVIGQSRNGCHWSILMTSRFFMARISEALDRQETLFVPTIRSKMSKSVGVERSNGEYFEGF